MYFPPTLGISVLVIVRNMASVVVTPGTVTGYGVSLRDGCTVEHVDVDIGDGLAISGPPGDVIENGPHDAYTIGAAVRRLLAPDEDKAPDVAPMPPAPLMDEAV
jgi:hypothetical protein